MLQAALAGGHRAPPLGLRAVRRGGSPRAAGTAWWPVSGGRSTPWSGSASTSRRWRSSPTAASSTTRRWSYLAGYRFTRRHLGLPRGRDLLPLLPAHGRRVDASPRRCCWRRCCCRSSTTTRRSPRPASRMTWAAGDRPCIEMGTRRTHEEAAVAARPGGVRRGVHGDLEPGRRAAARHPDDRHERAQLHAAARHRAGRVHRPGRVAGRGTTLLVDTYDIAEAVRLGGRDRRPGARRGAHRLRRPRACWPRRCATSSTRSARTDTRIVVTSDLDEHAIAALAAAPGRRLRRRHLAGDRQRPPDLRLRLQAGVALRTPTGEMVRTWRRRARTRSRSAAASTPCAAATPTGVAEAEVVGIGVAARRRRRRPRAARAAGRATARSSAARTSRRLAAAAPRGRARSCRCRRARCHAASRSSRRSTCSTAAEARLERMKSRADRRRRPERLLRGRQPAGQRRRGGGAPDRRAAAPLDRAGPEGAGLRRAPSPPRTTTSTPATTSASDPDFVDSWPRHCVVGHRRRRVPPQPRPAAVRRDLPQGRVRRGVLRLRGQQPRRGRRSPTGSARHDITDVDICGIATDYCVRATDPRRRPGGVPGAGARASCAPGSRPAPRRRQSTSSAPQASPSSDALALSHERGAL